MDISTKLKQLFCRGCGLDIEVLEDPYFGQRLVIYDPFFGCLKDWGIFCNEVSKYRNGQDYLKSYQRVINLMLNDIKSFEGYCLLKPVNSISLPEDIKKVFGIDILKPSNHGKRYLSISIENSEFSTLRYYAHGIFNGAVSWEDYAFQFTTNRFILNSSHICQSVFTASNFNNLPIYKIKLLLEVVDRLRRVIDTYDIVSFSDKEVTYSLDGISDSGCLILKDAIYDVTKWLSCPVKASIYDVVYVNSVKGYIKRGLDSTYEFSNFNSVTFPLVMLYLQGKKPCADDLVFNSEYGLSRLLKAPDVSFDL